MQGLFWRSEKMKRGNAIPVLILLISAVGCEQSKQAKETYKSDPPFWVSYKQNSALLANPVDTTGSFVQVEGCKEKKIKLVQVDCGDIGKGSRDFPCYMGCETIRIRADCEVKLGLQKETIINVISHRHWKAYFTENPIVDASGSWTEIEICVVAWKSKLYEKAPGTPAKIGELTITVKPRV
jgi:hypothetical protein